MSRSSEQPEQEASAEAISAYGYLDAGVQNVEAKNGASQTQLVSGLLAPNFLGFKGQEDLGYGLKANFVLESRFEVFNGAIQSGGNTLFNVAKVGLSSSLYGNLNLGRTVNFFWDNGLSKFDVTSGANMGSAAVVTDPGSAFTVGLGHMF